MKSFNSWMKEFLKDDRGQSTTEYILILSVVVMVALRFKKTFSDQMTKATEQLGGNISRAISDE